MAVCVCGAAGFAACSGGAEVKEFSVIGEVTVEIGEEYHIPAVLAVDEKGREYDAAYVVKQGDTVVETARDKLTVTSIDGYVITYTATVNKKEYTAETKIKVKDTVNPTVYFKETSVRVPVGEAAALPEYVVQDFSSIAEKTVTAHFMNAETGVTVENDTFTPTEKGFYRIDVSAKDALGNEGFGSAVLFAYEETAAGELGDVIEDFSSGYDSSLIYSKEDGKVVITPFIDGNDVSIKANTNGNYWPNINVSREFLQTYTDMYGKVLLTVYNEGAFAHQMYYQSYGEPDGNGGYTKNARYERFTIPAGGRADIEFTAETIAWHYGRSEDITLVIMNYVGDGNNEMFSVYFEKIIGRFADKKTVFAGDRVYIAPLWADIEQLAGKNPAGFEVYFNGEKIEDGVLSDSFAPEKAGDYQVRVLFEEDGYAAFDFLVRGRQMTLNENFEGEVDLTVYAAGDGAVLMHGESSFAPQGENALIVNYTTANGWPRLEIDWEYLQQFVGYYDYISLTVYNGGANMHQFYIEMPDKSALRRYDVPSGSMQEIRLNRSELQTLISNEYNLKVIAFNDNSANGKSENAFFLADSLKGCFTDLNARANAEIDLSHVFGTALFSSENAFDEFAVKIYGENGAEIENAVSAQNTVTLPAGDYTAVFTAKKLYYTDGLFEAVLHIRDAAYELSYSFEDGVVGTAYDGSLFTSNYRGALAVTSVSAGASDGVKSLYLPIDNNDGYPTFCIARSVLRDFYYVYGGMELDVYNNGAKGHSCYFTHFVGGTESVHRMPLDAKSGDTLSVSGEELLSLLDRDAKLEFVIINSGTDSDGGYYEFYFDNVRGMA